MILDHDAIRCVNHVTWSFHAAHYLFTLVIFPPFHQDCGELSLLTPDIKIRLDSSKIYLICPCYRLGGPRLTFQWSSSGGKQLRACVRAGLSTRILHHVC